jgi:hypothetical protein
MLDTYVNHIPKVPDQHWALSAEERLREIAREALEENKRLRAQVEKLSKRSR